MQIDSFDIVMAKKRIRRTRRKRRRRRSKTNKGATLNPYKRYQSGLRVSDVFPYREDNLCAFGCNTELVGRRKRWCSDECHKKALIKFWIIKGDNKVIRDELRKRDHFQCAVCGKVDENWAADHIVEVRHGGGACTLDNFQTLCSDHHKEKTKNNYKKSKNDQE